MRAVKRCQGCRRLLEVHAGTSFNLKEGSADGLQPYCRECDYNQKGESRHGWKNFQRRLIETGELHLWTQDAYETMMGDYRCHYCGTLCPRWGAGYWVDRIDNDIGYRPDNCVAACKPCNFRKSNDGPEQFHFALTALLTRYGRGKIPWAKVSAKFKECKAPDLSRYVVADPQLALGGVLGL